MTGTFVQIDHEILAFSFFHRPYTVDHYQKLVQKLILQPKLKMLRIDGFWHTFYFCYKLSSEQKYIINIHL